MEKNQVTTILFICPHHAAKSIMAAAYCNQIAAERGVALRADSAGTEPSAEVMPSVAALLASEGIDTAEFRPRRVTVEELSAAGWIVTFNARRSG
jgi:protein-tyrosine-phosphatase